MTKQFLKDSFGWGFVLWLIGYFLGIIFFIATPTLPIGWIIMPIGTAVTIWVLLKKVKSESLKHYILLSLIWTILAIILDYIFNVKMFNIADYYKTDIYIYYFLIFMLPIIVGMKRNEVSTKKVIVISTLITLAIFLLILGTWLYTSVLHQSDCQVSSDCHNYCLPIGKAYCQNRGYNPFEKIDNPKCSCFVIDKVYNY